MPPVSLESDKEIMTKQANSPVAMSSVEREYPFSLEDIFPGRQFSITLRSLKVKERNALNEQFLGLSKEDEDDFLYATAFLAMALVREPEGFEDFPHDESPLEQRALKYFRGLGVEWEEAILIVFNRWNKGGRPSFFMRPSGSSPGSLSITQEP